MDYEKILAKEPRELLKWLLSEFNVEQPKEILTVQDMELAAGLMLKLSGFYSYLCALLSYAKIATRDAKRGGDKRYHEDMVDKKDIIQNMTDSVKQQYASISRAVTIHQENNMELRMNSGGFIRKQ